MSKLIEQLAPYQNIFNSIFIVGLCLSCIFLLVYIYKVVTRNNQIKKEKQADIENIVGEDFAGRNLLDRSYAMRQIVAADGIDPNADPSYIIINDAGQNIYCRSFSIVSLPKKVVFSQTFNPLLNFSSATTSFHIEPIDYELMQKHVDNHINVLGAEANTTQDNNRRRRLNHQLREEQTLADNLETSSSSFYNVSFVITIKASTLDELATMTDQLMSQARSKKIDLACCFAVQSEAFLTNSLMAKKYRQEIKIPYIGKSIGSDAVEQVLFDQKALSTIFNYQQNDFDQPLGEFLGWNMPKGSIARWDPFLSKNGYNVILAGMTRSGKSVTAKVMVGRMAYNTRFVSVDSQRPAGLNSGEYTPIARQLNGVVYKISNNGGSDKMNVFEVEVTTRATTSETGLVTGEEYVFDLNDAKVSIANNIMMMITSNSATRGTVKDMDLSIYINEKVTDTISKLYDELEIYDGKPESLYEDMDSLYDLRDRRKKKLPTLTRFYEMLAYERAKADEQDKNIYKLIMAALKEYVTFACYNPLTGEIYTEEEFDKMKKRTDGTRYILRDGKEETIEWVRGSRLYYDGQSTISMEKKARFTNIDISSLPASEIALARSIAVHLVDQKFIKTNSENPSKAERLVVIYDEAHYLLNDPYASKIISAQARTCGKKHVSMWLMLQQLTDAENNADAAVVLDNTAYLFLYKHRGKSKEYVQKVTNMTDTQFVSLCDLGGDVDSEESKNRKGEVCLVTGKHSYFLKVAYMVSTEAELVETDASKRQEIYQKKLSSERA